MKSLSNYAGILLLTALTALPSQAAENQSLLQARVKSALNGMVQDVKAAENPAGKRAVMDQFLGRADRELGLLEKLPFLSEEKHAAIDMMKAKFGGYAAEIDDKGSAGIADQDLDAFASFMQQDLEQAAEIAWGSGGVYLSVGAIIIILLILILIT
jgi:hypothetical protein